VSEDYISTTKLASNCALRRQVTVYCDAGLTQVLNHDSGSIPGDQIVVSALSPRDVGLISNRFCDLIILWPVGRCINESSMSTSSEVSRVPVMDTTAAEHYSIPVSCSQAFTKVA